METLPKRIRRSARRLPPPVRRWRQVVAVIPALLLAVGLFAQSGTVEPGGREVNATNQPRAGTFSSPSTQGERIYNVRSGDTVYGIAKRFGITTKALQATDAGMDPHRLKVGQVLTISSPDIVVPPVDSDQLCAKDVAGYNQKIIAAAGRGEIWVKDPLQVVLHCLIQDSASPERWEFGERRITLRRQPPQLEVTIETTGLHDDSVGGEKYVILLGKDASGNWSLNNLSFGERCWLGRGHTNYSCEPCL